MDPPSVSHLDVNNASSRNLNAPSTRRASVPSSRGSFLNLGRSQAAAQSSSNAQPTFNGRPNSPLTPIPAGQRSTLPTTLASPTTAKSRHRVRPLTDPANRPWTQARIDKERQDWWDTRVTGSQEIWACLHRAVEYLQQGDVATAQGLLDAQECTCPNGQIWSGVYDDTGVLYKIPEWLIIEPAGLVDEEDESATTTTEGHNREVTTPGTETNPTASSTHDQASELDDAEFTVRARISTTATDVRIKVRRREAITSIYEKLRTKAQLNPDDRIVLVYGGRQYQDHETLESNAYWGFENEYVLSALVVTKEP
ncbi:hypothetical protein N0V94_006408 [Neodidymelliopsis sp. IMI 364377]|nr:hypothetical protein N0V94_006408 [Neodidymelliopsis sp. IMI 364377]